MNKRWILASAIAASLAACGGGSSGGSSGGGSSANVGGGVSKGIVIDGQVNAYGITSSGTIDRSTPLAEPTTTGQDGSYSLTLKKGYEGIVYVEITKGDDTVMRCDLAVCERDNEGNPSVVFGGNYSPANNFALAAVIPSASGEVSANITPLTHAAALLTLRRVASGADPSAAALAANAQIANRMGLGSLNLLDQPVLDITDPDALNAASRANIEYNLKAAAAVAAALDDDKSIEQALTDFADQYASLGIADREEVPAPELSLDEILEAAKALLAQIEGMSGVDNAAIAEAGMQVNVEQAKAKNEGSTESTQGEVPDDLGAEGLVATKAFVNQLRNVATAAILAEKEQSLDSFTAKVEQAAILVGEDQVPVFEAAAQAMAAIAEAFDLVHSDEQYSSPFTASNGVEVAIAQADGRTLYSVDGQISGADVSITASDNSSIEEEYTRTETNPPVFTREAAAEEEMAGYSNTITEEETFDASADLKLSGTVSNDFMMFTISEGSSLSGTLVGEWKSEETTNEDQNGYSYDRDETDSFTLSNLAATVKGSLATSGEGDNGPVTFSGEIVLSVGEYAYQGQSTTSDSWSMDGYSYAYDDSSTAHINDFSLDLYGSVATSGAIAIEGGDELTLNLSLMVDGLVENCQDYGNHSYSEENGYSDDWGYGCDLEENASEYADASVSLAFNLNLDGISDIVALTATASRTGLRQADFDIELSYAPASSLSFSHSADFSDDAADPVLTVTNHNDVMMTLTENAEGDISGSIRVGDKAFAVIDEDAGVPVVTFNDGTFESF